MPLPMSKIAVSKVAEIMKREQVDPDVLRRIVEQMNLEVQPEPGDEDKLPAVKKQFVILVSDPEGKMPKHNLVGWVLQIPDDESPYAMGQGIIRTIYDFNTSKKGCLMQIKTLGEAFENIPSKFFKENDLWVKTKTPVIVISRENELHVNWEGATP